MKRFIVLLTIFAMCIAFTACGSEQADTQENNQQQTEEQEAIQQQDVDSEQSNDIKKGEGLSVELFKSGSVSDVLTAVSIDNIGEFSTYEYDRNLFADVLNEASGDELTSDEASKLGAVEALSEELPNETPWWTSFSVMIDNGESGSITLFENNKTDITTVKIGSGSTSKTAFYKNQALYDLVRRTEDSESIVDKESFDKYGREVQETTETNFETYKQDMGLTDIKLVHFEKVWEGKGDDGNDLALFEYEYSVGTEEPEMFMLAGGERFDYEMRVRSFNGFYGQLAVKTKDGQLLNSALLTNDEMVYVDGTAEDDKLIRDRIVGRLN